MDLSTLLSNEFVLGGIVLGSVKAILGKWIQAQWQNFRTDAKWQFGDDDPATPDYAEFCGPDGKWSLVQIHSKCWWKNTIHLSRMTLVEDKKGNEMYEYSPRVIDYETFKSTARAQLSPEQKARVKAVVAGMAQVPQGG